jgi:hypothetical protein
VVSQKLDDNLTIDGEKERYYHIFLSWLF